MAMALGNAYRSIDGDLEPCNVEIVQKLVSGGIADVWFARSRRDGSHFVVKYSHDNNLVSPQARIAAISPSAR